MSKPSLLARNNNSDNTLCAAAAACLSLSTSNAAAAAAAAAAHGNGSHLGAHQAKARYVDHPTCWEHYENNNASERGRRGS